MVQGFVHGRDAYLTRPAWTRLGSMARRYRMDPRVHRERDPWPQKLSVWGCLSAQGVGAFDFFDGRTNSRKLKELFDKHLVRAADQLCPRGKWSILQDNASYHGAKIIQNWLQEHKVDCIEITSYSIENLRADLKRRIEAGNPRTIEQLKEILISEWQSTSKPNVS